MAGKFILRVSFVLLMEIDEPERYFSKYGLAGVKGRGASPGRNLPTVKVMNDVRFTSMRRATEAHGVHYSLGRRLKGGTSGKAAHIKEQLLSTADEKAIVRWIVWMEEFGFPPRILTLWKPSHY